jgi:F-type H+-transporting ATPase subunit a
MPEHDNFLTLLLEGAKENLEQNAGFIGKSFVAHQPAGWHSFEPIIASACVIVVILFIARSLRVDLEDLDKSVIPESGLTLRTFMEAFVGYFYDLAKSAMDAERAKRYFPVIGASALFVFCSNALALVPGMPVPTSNMNVTLGCAMIVFVLFNIYGIMTQGFIPYFKHMGGPLWYMFPLIFAIEFVSLCVRPFTLALRLMINMSVDHLILGIGLSLFPLFLPIPLMLLGIIVVLVQTMVFTLLTAIYIGLATEREAH